MPALKNPRHEVFAQALARGVSAAAAYGQVGFKPHRANAATLARKKHISARVAELQEEQLAIHQQATAAAAANKQVAIESLIVEAAAAVSALTAKANLDPRRIKPGGSSRLHGEPMLSDASH
jgi:phage terminase small subunit